MTPRRARRRGMVAGAVIANSRSKKAGQTAPVASGAPAPQAGPNPDMTKQLTDLKGLLDNGILTQEEFDAKKKQILSI